MKKLIVLFFAVLSIVFIGCKKDAAAEAKANLPVAMATTSFNIEGMHCEVGCAAKVEKKLAKLDGVENATIDFERKLATVTYNKNVNTAEDLVETVMSASKDYVVSNIETKPISNK
jgi:copper chaperone CopZ